jgi:hypothetical protein
MVNFLPGMELPALALLGIFAFVVESIYVGRLTVAANGIVIVSAFGLNAILQGGLFGFWILGGIILTVLVVVSYIKDISLDESVYDILNLAYGSKTVLGVIIAGMFGAIEYALVPVVLIWFVCVYFLGHKMPFS